MNKILANCISLGIGLGAIGVTFPAQAASFQGLGDLPGVVSLALATGVSADGSVVVGNSQSANGLEAFRWTQATGMVGLGDLPGGDFRSQKLVGYWRTVRALLVLAGLMIAVLLCTVGRRLRG
jgi:probable HAF family extracellular repeat protein